MSSISDLLIAKGNAQANARSQRGNIYAHLIENLSSIPGQVIQQQRATQQDALRQQALNQQLELGKGEQDLQRQRLTMAQSEAQDKQKATARQTSIDAVLGADVYGEDGDIDIDKVRALAAKSDPSIVPHAVAVAQKLNQQTGEYREQQAKTEQAQLALAGRRNDAIGMAGLELMAPGEVDEGSYQLAIGQFVKHKLVDPQQAEAWLSASTPAERKANVASMIRGSKEATAMLPKPTPPKLMQQDPTKNVIDENTLKVVIPAVEGAAKNETRSLDVQAADALAKGDMVTYKRLLKVKKEMGQADDRPLVSVSPERLVKVEHNDPATGKTVIEWLPQGQLAGKTFEKGTSATVANRLASATAVNQVGNDIISRLQDPGYAKKIGPIMGRFSTLQDFIGNPPPEFAELAGSIESYALANMGVHGMRSVQGADQIKKLLNEKHTPESLVATIKGLNEFSSHFLENEGRKVPQAAPPPPAGTIKVGGFTLTPK